MKPEDAVTLLAGLLEEKGETTDEAIYGLLCAGGVPEVLADRALKFAQIAWGRAFLADLGIRFPREYMWLSADGEVVESGMLDEEPCFVVAERLAPRFLPLPGVLNLALRSADVGAVNSLLHNGSKPENLVLAAPLLFREPPTRAGLAAADALTAAYLSQHAQPKPSGAPDSTSRRWWQLWK